VESTVYGRNGLPFFSETLVINNSMKYNWPEIVSAVIMLEYITINSQPKTLWVFSNLHKRKNVFCHTIFYKKECFKTEKYVEGLQSKARGEGFCHFPKLPKAYHINPVLLKDKIEKAFDTATYWDYLAWKINSLLNFCMQSKRTSFNLFTVNKKVCLRPPIRWFTISTHYFQIHPRALITTKT